MFKTKLVLSALILFLFGCHNPNVAPKLALVTPKSIVNIGIEEVAQYDLVMGVVRPERAEEIRELNPDIILLHQTDPFECWPITNWQSWMAADTTWSIDRLVQYYVIKNKELNSEWLLKTTTGNYISRYNKMELNFSDFCPKGAYGTSKGLIFRDWLAKVAYPQIISNELWQKYYDGFHFDVFESCSTWDITFKNVDLNLDGINDSSGYISPCYNIRGDSNLFRTQQHNAVELFTNNLFNSISPLVIVTVGQDRIDSNCRSKFNGWKLERWMRQSGASKQWIDWWKGTNNTTGYKEAEEVLFRYGEDDRYDEFQGWDYSVLDVKTPVNITYDEVRQFARFALGTSLLGDGYFALQCENYNYITIPEMFNWKFKLPAKTEAYVKNNLYCRQYERLNDGKLVTVIVDLDNKNSYIYEGAY